MTAFQFKLQLKNIKEDLKGLTIQFCSDGNVTPFKTLKEFGNAVLEAQNKNNDFHILRVWNNGVVKSVSSFDQLKKEIKNGANAVSFSANKDYKTFSNAMSSDGFLD